MFVQAVNPASVSIMLMDQFVSHAMFPTANFVHLAISVKHVLLVMFRLMELVLLLAISLTVPLVPVIRLHVKNVTLDSLFSIILAFNAISKIVCYVKHHKYVKLVIINQHSVIILAFNVLFSTVNLVHHLISVQIVQLASIKQLEVLVVKTVQFLTVSFVHNPVSVPNVSTDFQLLRMELA